MVSTVFDRKHEAVCIQTCVPVHEVNIDFIIDLVYSQQSHVFILYILSLSAPNIYVGKYVDLYVTCTVVCLACICFNTSFI